MRGSFPGVRSGSGRLAARTARRRRAGTARPPSSPRARACGAPRTAAGAGDSRARSASRRSPRTRMLPDERDPVPAAERGHLAARAVAKVLGAPRRFPARRRAWRSACWQVAGSVSPGVASFGTAAQSPSAHTLEAPMTRSLESTGTRPCSSSGRPSSRSSGFGVMPAVQTAVSVSIRLPSPSVTAPASTEASVVSVRISTPRPASVRGWRRSSRASGWRRSPRSPSPAARSRRAGRPSSPARRVSPAGAGPPRRTSRTGPAGAS